MNVLIVDDEPHVIEAIRLMVPWEQYGIDTVMSAGTVEEACEVLRRDKPDIAFVDVKIGDREGTEVLTCIRDLGLGTRAITISGYDDYQYVRSMFLLGSMDYLLKPLEIDDVLHSLEKAIGQLDEQGQKSGDFGIDILSKSLFPDHQHGLLRKLFQENMQNSAYSELCRTNGKIAEAAECRVLSCDGMFLPLHIQGFAFELSEFLNELQQKLEKNNSGTLFQRNHPAPDIVLLLYADFEEMLNQIQKSCDDFNRTSEWKIRFGCSLPVPFCSGIQEATRQSETASNMISPQMEGSVIYYRSGMPVRAKTVRTEQEHPLQTAILTGDAERMLLCLHEWLVQLGREVPHTQGGMHTIYDTLYSVYSGMVHSLSVTEKPVLYHLEHFSESYSAYDGGWDSTLENLERLSAEVFTELLETIRGRSSESDRMHLVARYLELNYPRRIQLSDCADVFHLNKDYLNRCFQARFGISVSSYLTRVRMEKAEEYLRKTNLSCQEIADAIGIADGKYFIKKFKHEKGMTPIDYRSRFSKA